ncbi:hypothetical protein ACP70R_040038 [Stipagrostis hirtigluma subsp. patula]
MENRVVLLLCVSIAAVLLSEQTQALPSPGPIPAPSDSASTNSSAVPPAQPTTFPTGWTRMSHVASRRLAARLADAPPQQQLGGRPQRGAEVEGTAGLDAGGGGFGAARAQAAAGGWDGRGEEPWPVPPPPTLGPPLKLQLAWWPRPRHRWKSGAAVC